MTNEAAAKEPGLKITTARNVIWSTISLVGAQVISIMGTAVLARHLMPSDFGLLGLVGILTGLVMLMGNFGLGSAIVYRQDVDADHLSTSYWFNLALGLVLTLFTILTAPLAARYFHNDLVKPVAIVLSFNFLINSFSWASGCLLMKDLRFRTLAIIRISTVVVRAVVAILLAVYFEAGVWSLVLADILMNTCGSIARFYSHPWRPELRFRWDKFRELFSYGINLTGASIFDYFSRNIDQILIGRLLTATQLGFYQFSYSIPHVVQSGFTQSLNRVLFPVYCRVQDDNERFARGLTRTLRIISLVSFPFLVGMIVVAGPFVRTLYGVRWEPVIVPLQILCVAAMASSILATNGSVLNAKGRPDISFKWSVFRLPLTFGIVYGCSRWGVLGIATGVAVSALLSIIPAKIASGLVDLPFRQWFVSLGPAVVCSGLMAAVLLLVEHYVLPDGFADIPTLLVLVPLGILVYFSSFRLLYRADWDETKELALGAISSSRRGRTG